MYRVTKPIDLSEYKRKKREEQEQEKKAKATKEYKNKQITIYNNKHF